LAAEALHFIGRESKPGKFRDVRHVDPIGSHDPAWFDIPPVAS